MASNELAVIERLIFETRGQKVMLDADLARIYAVQTKALNQAIKRNAERFPEDFVFQLMSEEVGALRCQIGTSNLRSQIATSKRRSGRRYLPWAFTEHGAIATNLAHIGLLEEKGDERRN